MASSLSCGWESQFAAPWHGLLKGIQTQPWLKTARSIHHWIDVVAKILKQSQLSSVQHPLSFHRTGWLIGIPTLDDSNPRDIG